MVVAIFDNLKFFKNTCTEIFQGLERTESITNCKVNEGSTYAEHIDSRLEFLHFLPANSSFKLSQSHIDDLWDIFYERSACSYEKDAFLRWFGEVTDS
jgi:hypothetical protein